MNDKTLAILAGVFLMPERLRTSVQRRKESDVCGSRCEAYKSADRHIGGKSKCGTEQIGE